MMQLIVLDDFQLVLKSSVKICSKGTPASTSCSRRESIITFGPQIR